MERVHVECEAGLHPENLVFRDGVASMTISSNDQATLQQPAKRPTRQWAAWTRQEEESFFSALRQVGKNFEKITSRVQSKNKDQVRHYYYRLVRRMNKFLGPELCLDAKNSKDTNAAMLRWWSLLEKYSCKASKLHLKPRRFKIFIETLESQLLKDRKKNIRKRPFQGENSSTTALTIVASPGRMLGHDNRAVKMVPLESQNIQKFGSAKGSSPKRHVNIGVNHGTCKLESSPVKAARHRRKIGTGPTAAHRRWEQAAVDGVSLVADAAEHLERMGTTEKVAECLLDAQLHNEFDHVRNDAHSLQSLTQNLDNENNMPSSMKLKLQLFPIDDGTRRALELDNHNPHLELTLSARKKISSVLEHLNRKWGNSSVAFGELMLLPYGAQRETVVCNLRWKKDSILSAADVHALIGSPAVFRLRYGWFSNAEHGTAKCEAPSTTISKNDAYTKIAAEEKDSVIVSTSLTHIESEQRVSPYLNRKNPVPTSCPPVYHEHDQLAHPCKDHLVSTPKMMMTSSVDVPNEMIGFAGTGKGVSSPRNSSHASVPSMQNKETESETVARQVDNADDVRTLPLTGLSAGEWADSLTNISIGDLLSEFIQNEDANSVNTPVPGSPLGVQQIPFSCDSFDAAIAAHIYKHQNKANSTVALGSHSSSIWDAEETCDAFAFKKSTVCSEKVPSASRMASLETCKQVARTNPTAFPSATEEAPDGSEDSDDDAIHQDPIDECHSQHAKHNSAKDFAGLSDIYWPDSLGPLDLDIPSRRYYSDDLILTDSLGGLNRLIASSLDAFQSCSFFGMDKKNPTSTVEARETT